MPHTTVHQIKKELRKHASREKARVLQGFFKTGQGEYGEGDIFLGIKVPDLRSVAKKYAESDFETVENLLGSPIHEERLLALLILILKFKKGDQQDREKIYTFYLGHSRRVNNWDLVDLSAPQIVGDFLYDKSKAPLYTLVKSRNLWERRIAIIATFFFIKNNSFEHTLEISRMLLADKEDLIHKAVGWMLRETGKRDANLLEDFLKKHCDSMPRTTLRYAIERFPESKRKAYLLRMPNAQARMSNEIPLKIHKRRHL